MIHLHVDIETYSSVNLKTSGAYKYAASPDFEILCMAWAYNDDEVNVAPWDEVPASVIRDLKDPKVLKIAHSAMFERVCFREMGIDTGYTWLCTAVLSSYNGLPLSLREVSMALELGDKGKSTAGAALISYFCGPVKPTKKNNGRSRNFPRHDLEKWNAFLAYNKQDVVAEKEVYSLLKSMLLPEKEQVCYIVDQQINDRGVRVDVPFIESVLYLYEIDIKKLEAQARALTGLSNPNSPAQLKRWIGERTGERITSLTKETLETMHFDDEDVMELLGLRQKLSRTSIKKYRAMLNCVMADGRIRGLFQFMGAKTARWAGRLVQTQNLPRNYYADLDAIRKIVLSRNYDLLDLLFEDIQEVLVQLIRTAFIPEADHLTMSDYSQMEARITAWLAGEKWRMDLFNDKEEKDIYKASASRMFGIPMDAVSKHDRQKGKVSELALGYQGGVNALERMGGAKMGLSRAEMQELVTYWRNENPAIVKYWKDIQNTAMACIRMKKKINFGGFNFECDDRRMTIELLSGRKICYWKARIVKKNTTYGPKDGIQYMWADSETKGKWMWVDTYGGKLVENIVQATQRDFLSEALVRSRNLGCDIVMHIHDEIVIENGVAEDLEAYMKVLPVWAKDFPINAKAEETKYFKK